MTTTFLVPKNNASSKLAADIAIGDLSLAVLTGEGARFPSTYPYHITIADEIMSVTNRSSDTLTVTRAQESTSAAAHNKGAPVRLNITARALSDIHTAVNGLETSVGSLELAPPAHASSHQNGGADEISVAGLSGELADAQPPKAHKTSHESGGSDAIKIDDLSAPDDNTDLNASTIKHGLCPKAPDDTAKFLRGDMTWNAPVSTGASLNFDGSTRVLAAGNSTSWTDLDLSSYVGANRAVVCLRVTRLYANLYTWSFRRNGETSQFYDYEMFSMNNPRTSGSDSFYVIVHTDSSGIIEYRAENANAAADVYLEWYLK